MSFEKVHVETMNFYTGHQEPRRILWRDRWWEITEVVDRWYEGYVSPKKVPLRYYRVKTREGRFFLLKYNGLFDAWALKELKCFT